MLFTIDYFKSDSSVGGGVTTPPSEGSRRGGGGDSTKGFLTWTVTSEKCTFRFSFKPLLSIDFIETI